MSITATLSGNRPFDWVKRGLLFEPPADAYTHGSHPCAIHVEDDRFVIAFTRRDRQQRSHIFLVQATVDRGSITLADEPRLAMSPGEPGWFDCDGVISVCPVHDGQADYLYYVGWQNLPGGLWTCDTGRARLDLARLTMDREFCGPVLGRNKDHPLFAAATAFHVEDGLWRTWFNSGIRWERAGTGWKHYYGIHYGTSEDGVTWTTYPGLVIPFADEYEYAFGRPCVIKSNGRFLMWFAHRATRDIDSYRIGFAWSEDGRKWHRDDSRSGIDVSGHGWDSEMICYPFVFRHKDCLYMLYNGNGYGRSGFGYAFIGVGA